MKTLALAAAAALTFAAASTTADARPLGGTVCPKWICGGNGTQLTGIALATEAKRPVANAVTFPSGETVDLR